MRYIPPDLLAKIKSAQQTIYNNADPKMKIITSRGFTKELFIVETIHNKDNLSDLDTALKRSSTIAKPHEAYLIYIENDRVKTAKKELPYDPMVEWEYQFEVDMGFSVAIEFNGYWERDYKTRRFNFVTEDVPWIFWVDPVNDLQAQLWDDENTKTELAEDVVKVVAMRGWIPAEAGHTDDQGLIVAYTKSDGLVYYRNYCIQSTGEYAWEVERQIVALPGPADNIGIFRTNDFRVGFLAEVAGAAHWALTTRNYSGMSVWPETIKASISSLSIDFIPIKYTDLFSSDEYILTTSSFEANLCPFDTEDTAIISSKRTSATTLRIRFNQLVLNTSGQQEAFIIKTQSGDITYTASATSGSGDTLEITTIESVPITNSLTVIYDASRGELRDYVTAYCKRKIQSFEVIALGSLPEIAENITVSVNKTIAFNEILKPQRYAPDEKILSSLSGMTIVFTKVNDNPL